MNQTWYSLYLPMNDSESVAGALRALLEARGFRPYDPFPGGTGTPTGLRESVRQFVAPAQNGWVRVLGQPAETILPAFSQETGLPVIYAWLTEKSGGLAVFREGERLDDPKAFQSYLRPDSSPEQLELAFEGKLPVPVLDSDEPLATGIGADALPPDVRRFAKDKGVDECQASRLFKKLSASLFGKLGGGGESKKEQEQARALVMGGKLDLWNSLHGQRVRAIAGLLTLPDNWRLPTWETVRDAYHVHRLRERSPRMPLLPGDKEALNAVPDALSYLPVYLGLS
ncbi:MAG: hypothetical protein JW910_10315 [Anaerolineae bacterium]|nr:hypothetical protein [Anaerolineae bacterium]